MKDDRRREAEEMTAELKGYVREGVSLWLDGQRCSPGRAASACLLREDSCYMRDYVCDEQNRVVAIHFDRVEPEEERSLPYGRGYAGFSGSRRNQGVPLQGALLLPGKSKTICADTCENRKNVL